MRTELIAELSRWKTELWHLRRDLERVSQFKSVPQEDIQKLRRRIETVERLEDALCNTIDALPCECSYQTKFMCERQRLDDSGAADRPDAVFPRVWECPNAKPLHRFVQMEKGGPIREVSPDGKMTPECRRLCGMCVEITAEESFVRRLAAHPEVLDDLADRLQNDPIVD